MFYAAEVSDHITNEAGAVMAELQSLQLQTVVQGHAMADPSVREHLLHGVVRRLGVMKRSIANVFRLFPLTTLCPLSTDDLADVQINLHAFVINLLGIYDNWAWAFVLRHGLEREIGDRRLIGLFNQATQKHLPTELQSHLMAPETIKWHKQYAKNYRDALAHRIPLYIPPATFTTREEGERHSNLETERVGCIQAMQWERLEAVYAEQAALGRPCFAFLHSFSEEPQSCPLLLHPQMLSDSRAAVEFGTLFLKHWHARTSEVAPSK